MQVQSLGWEDPLEEIPRRKGPPGLGDTLEEDPHSIILVWRIPWTEEPDVL